MPFYQSRYRPIMIDKAIANRSTKTHLPLRAVDLWRWLHPGRAAKCQHDNAVRLSFRAADRGSFDPIRSADAGSCPPIGGHIGACYLGWCGRWESNPHSLRNGILNPARLPIPPRPRCERPIARRSKCAMSKANYSAYFVDFAAFLRAATGLGRALRTLTADASMLFFKCRP